LKFPLKLRFGNRIKPTRAKTQSTPSSEEFVGKSLRADGALGRFLWQAGLYGHGSALTDQKANKGEREAGNAPGQNGTGKIYDVCDHAKDGRAHDNPDVKGTENIAEGLRLRSVFEMSAINAESAGDEKVETAPASATAASSMQLISLP